MPLRSAAGDDHGYLPAERRDMFVRTVSANDADLHVDAEVAFLGRASAGTTSRPYPPDCKPAVQADAPTYGAACSLSGQIGVPWPSNRLTTSPSPAPSRGGSSSSTAAAADTAKYAPLGIRSLGSKSVVRCERYACH